MKKVFLPAIILLGIGTSVFSQSLEPCRNESGLFGYCDKDGNTVIEHAYYDALDFIEGHAAVQVNDKWAIINENGHQLVPPSYDEVFNCVNVHDQILVRVGEKWFFTNSYGIQMTNEYEVAAPWYEFELNGPEANFHEDTWFSVIKKGKWGVINLNDEVVLPFDFEWTRVVRRTENGKESVIAFILKNKGKYAWQRVDAKAATGYEFDAYLGEYEDLLFFRKGDRATIMNGRTGERIQNAKRSYYNLIDAEDSVGLVSADGRILVPFKYNYIDIAKVENFVVFGFRDDFGLADMDGNVILKKEYKDIRHLTSSPPMVAVKDKEGKVAVMEINGTSTKKVTDFKYDYAVMDGEQIRIKMGDKLGFLTKTGTETWQ